MRAFLPLALGASLIACGQPTPPAMKMKIEQDALGRVVVYRNGVAYYERKVEVVGDSLAVTVPRARVDDFLKSLTVQDARTGQPLPVSFSRQEAEASGNVVMVMKLPREGHHDLRLTYVTESPAWKPSYRVVVDQDGKVTLQGWAIVDNTSGEEWKGVRVGVGSSSALSFRYDLWNVRDVHRQTLRGEERFAAAPPNGVSPYKQGHQTRVAVLEDGEIERPKDHPDNQIENEYYPDAPSSGAGGGGGGGGGGKIKPTAARGGEVRPKKPAPDSSRWSQGNDKLKQLATELKKGNRNIVVNGYADRDEPNAEQSSLDR